MVTIETIRFLKLSTHGILNLRTNYKEKYKRKAMKPQKREIVFVN